MSRVVVLRDFAGSPDHNHCRNYKKGEVFEVGSTLMPEGFVENLLHEYVPSGSLVGLITLHELEGKTAEPCIKVEDKSLTSEQMDRQIEAHNQLYQQRKPMDW
jgi:hypothetical protein